MTGARPLRLALAILAGASVLWLGVWTPDPGGIDAVSAVTPGHVAVVGAASISADGAPVSATEDDLVVGAIYLSGGLHKAIDPAAEWIVVRPGHAPMDARAVAQHARVVRAVLGQLAEVAPEARLSLLVGAVAGASVPDGLAAALRSLADDDELGARLEVLDLADEELEEVAVPDGGVAADAYPFPVTLLECDAVINVARLHGPLSALANLEGLAPAAGEPPDREGRRIDLALLAEVDFTVLDMLAHEGSGDALILAGQDGIAVDRVAIALLGAGSEAVPPLARAAARRLGKSILTDIKVAGLPLPGTWTPPASGG